MPELVKSSVGSFAGTSGLEATTVWPLPAKYSRNFVRISLLFIVRTLPQALRFFHTQVDRPSRSPGHHAPHESPQRHLRILRGKLSAGHDHDFPAAVPQHVRVRTGRVDGLADLALEPHFLSDEALRRSFDLSHPRVAHRAAGKHSGAQHGERRRKGVTGDD